MSTVTLSQSFSAIEYVHKLRKVHFTEEQAEAVVEIIERQALLTQGQRGEIDALKAKEPATKNDLEITKLELQKEMEIIRKEMEVIRREIVEAKNQTIICTFGMMVVFAGAIISIMAKGFHWF